MKKFTVLIAMMVCYVLVTGVLLAQDTAKPKNGVPATGPSKNDNPTTTVAGVIKDLPADGGKPVAALGHRGCLVIRSPERWKAVIGKFVGAGWTDKQALPKTDFDKQMVVFAFNYGDQGDKFICHNYSGDADNSALDLQVNYGGYRRRDKEVNYFHYLLIVMPQSKKLEVAISTSGYDSTAPNDRAAAKLEWKATFGPESGDIVDGLRGTVGCDSKTVKTGEEISVVLTLERAKPEQVANGHFAKPVDKVFVWDAVYSKGYRNHAFLVKTPDGNETIFRPKTQGFDENAPHPVEVAAGKPYVLPGLSLKELGLDTSKPGTYTIAGIYTETAQQAQTTTADDKTGAIWGKTVALWGGDIATNTITVKVTKD